VVLSVRDAALFLAQKLLGERFDGFTRSWSETRELVRLEKTMALDRGELPDHPGAPGVVECVRQLFVPVAQQTENIEVALMVTTRSILAKAPHFIENAFAEPIESYLPEFAEDSPV